MKPDVSFVKTKSLDSPFVVMSICLDHERLFALVTPKYFAEGTLSSSTLYRMYLVLRRLPFCDLKDLTFRGVKLHIPHLFHCSWFARSICRSSLSEVELIARYKALSSAKRLTLDLTYSGRSFMCTRKRIRPRT